MRLSESLQHQIRHNTIEEEILKTPQLFFTIAVLGGTGKEGRGLVFRLSKAGYRVLIGSRSLKKARIVTEEMIRILGSNAVIHGYTNLSAAQ